MDLEQDPILTMDDLAVYLKVSKSTLYKLVQEGKVPGHKVGKHWRFRQRVNPIVYPYPTESLNEGKDCNFVKSECANW